MENICTLKKLVSQFVDTYMEEVNYFPLHEDDADYIVEYFRDLLFEDYRPEGNDNPVDNGELQLRPEAPVI